MHPRRKAHVYAKPINGAALLAASFDAYGYDGEKPAEEAIKAHPEDFPDGSLAIVVIERPGQAPILFTFKVKRPAPRLVAEDAF